MTGPWNTQAQYLGAFIRNRRKLARLSLRQLAETTTLSNAYLSQLERGLHLPSLRVLKLLSEALNVSAETLLAQAGLLDLAPSGDGAAAADGPPASPVESAISADERLARCLAIMGTVAGRPAYTRKMAWLMPRMAKAVPYLGYIVIAGTKPV